MSQALIVSDREPISAKVRQVLSRAGHECPAANTVGFDSAYARLTLAQPELVVLVLSADVERCLAVLRELRSKSAGRFLVVGSTADSKLVLRALRIGAEDYLDEADLEAELNVALARQKADQSTQAEAGRLIAVLAPSGGSGSSTVAVNIATVLAKEHKSAVLVDLKLEVGDLAALLDLKPNHTLADLCQNFQRMDRVMFENSLVRHDSGVQLLAAPRMYGDIPLVTPEGVHQAITLAQMISPYVVVDLDHSFRAEQMQVLRLAEVIVLVLRLDFSSLRNARRTLDYLGQLGIDTSRVRLVVNRSGMPKEVPAAKAEEALGVKIFHYIPDEPRIVNRANNNGVPVVLEAPSAKVSKSVTRLAHSINGRHQAP